jgi:hypothetical protein
MDAKAMLAEAQSELAAARRKVTQYEQLVKILSELSSVAFPVSGAAEVVLPEPKGTVSTYLKPKNAILQWMREHASTPYSPKEVFDGLRDRLLVDPRIASGQNAYTTALRRLSQDERVPITQTPDGRYVYQTTSGLTDTSLEYASLPQSPAAEPSDGEAE